MATSLTMETLANAAQHRNTSPMSVTYEQAPVYEVGAEFRWDLPGIVTPPGTIGINFADTGSLEAFVMKFAGEVYAAGFEQAERLTPPGFIAPIHRVVLRLSNPRATHPILYQVGPGVFTANALNPYSGWEKFEVAILKGLEAMLKARPEGERAQPINHLQIRYQNSFHGSHLRGKSALDFVSQDLRIPLPYPAGLDSARTGQMTDLQTNFSLPLADDFALHVQVLIGNLPTGASGVALNLSVVFMKAIEPTVEAIAKVCVLAHAHHRRAFEAFIDPFRGALRPGV